MRKPTPEEELAAFKSLMWSIDLHRTITLNEKAVIAALNRISTWVQSHADANGERPASEVQKNINEAFWTQIAQHNPPPLPEKKHKTRKT